MKHICGLVFLFIPSERKCFVYTNTHSNNRVILCVVTLIDVLHTLDNVIALAYSNPISNIVAETIEFISKTELLPEELFIVKEIHQRLQILKQRGISVRTIKEALLQFNSFSRITISEDNRVVLTDFDNMEIKLKPLTRAIYIMFLRHPEGIRLKELSLYQNELEQLYADIFPKSNPARRAACIHNLCDPTHNSLNEKISAIRNYLSRIIDESLLPVYSIQGKPGERYQIGLFRFQTVKK